MRSKNMSAMKEKIVEQVFCADFKRSKKIPPSFRSLDFLRGIEFHSVVLCEAKDKERRGSRVLLRPNQMKALLARFDVERQHLWAANGQQEADNEKEQHRLKVAVARLKEEIAKLHERHKEELERVSEDLKREYGGLIGANAQLLKNLADRKLVAKERPSDV